jgi:hypothetical protein
MARGMERVGTHYSLLEGDWIGILKARMEEMILGIQKTRL